jgi:phosphoribosylformylglycinamidine synthase
VRNASLQFRSQPVYLRVENAETPFTNAYERGQVLKMPIAHGEGNFVAEPEVLERLEGEGLVVLRYVDPNGDATPESNPNGASNNIAGIVNDRGNVLGLMPHPERAIDPLLGSEDGVGIFESIKQALAAGVR